MKNFVWTALIMAGLCTACNNVKETPRGLQFSVIRKGSGRLVAPKEFLLLHVKIEDGNDSVWNQSLADEPILLMVEDTTHIQQEDGLDEIWRMLSIGDSIQFKIPTKRLFENSFHQPVPAHLDPKSDFEFNIGVANILSPEEAQKYGEQMRQKYMAKAQKQSKEQLMKDIQAIDHFLDSQKIEAIKDTTGLRYRVTRAGKGINPSLQDSVVVKYVGKLMQTGEIFDQSSSPVSFPLAGLIQGWRIGFPLLKEGTTATLYVPSSLGYGLRGSPPAIPANANLIFEVELIKVKKQK